MSISAMVVLTPSESKRLIAKAVAKMPLIEEARQNGYILIAGGTTNAYVAEELSDISISDKTTYTVGMVADGALAHSAADSRVKPIILKDGSPIEADWNEIVEKLGPGDVFIKGANAIDLEGNAGVLASNPVGGTIGRAWGILTARGVNLLMPVGLEKLIPSVAAAAAHCGQKLFTYTDGVPCGLIPVTTGMIITEIEALDILFDVHGVHVASGGQGESQGAVAISFHGPEEKVKAAFEFIKEEL